MDVKISTGRRITIPKDLFDETEFKEGDILDLQFIDGKFIMCKKTSTLENLPVKKPVNKVSTDNKFTRKIVSNLEEGQHFSKKYYSPCELVIRTKNRYLKEFCEECKGQLLDQGYKNNGKCKYRQQTDSTDTCNKCNGNCAVDCNNSKSTIKDKAPNSEKLKNAKTKTKLIEEIYKNAIKVSEKIDNNIAVINRSTSSVSLSDTTPVKAKKHNSERVMFMKQLDKKTLQPVNLSNSHRKCTNCGEFFSKGFLIDEDFYCKSCAAEDFKLYMEMKRKVSK